MKNFTPVKSIALKVLLLVFISFPTYAQVGIGNTAPNADALLDVGTDTSTAGLRLPRVALTGTANVAPLSAHVQGMMVYNTATTGDVLPGQYYNDGAKWILLASNDWKLTGNSGTTAGTNFIGTIDTQDVVIKANNIERARIGITETVINEDSNDYDFRIESNNLSNAFFVDGLNDNIGFGTNAPNTSSQLEMAAINKGLLINKVILSATNVAAPITTPATGLLIYNTATASTGSTAVTPGFYYWNGSKWIAMDGSNGRDWSLTGNAGTNPSTNFLGTTDDTDFVLRTNSTERMRFANTGVAGIGAAPYTNVALRVSNSAQPFGVIGETNSGGSSIYGIQNGSGQAIRGNNSSSGLAVLGENTGTGIGVFGVANNAHGVYGTTSYTGGTTLTAGTVGWGAGNNNANGVLAVADKNSSTASNTGIRAVSGSTTSISSSQVMNVAVNANATDLGLYVMTEKTAGIREAARFQTNYTGSAVDADARDMRARLAGYTNASEQGGSDMYYGGYFYSGGDNNGSWAYAGSRYGSTNYKIIGNGTVTTIVSGANQGDSKKIMFAPEAPEVLFEDYGSGQLSNGTTTINIDPIFSKNITVNNEHPLRVFIQLEGDCNGVYVTNKSANGFTVKELQNGNSNTSFSWHIVANRANEASLNGGEETIYADLRFPDAPAALAPQTMKSIKVAPKNIKEEIKLEKKSSKK
ncbi:MAG: hypothetical protein L3J09_01135 [Flavobacteriaceae bacterium]|nr:hypothetical protein [Flavobacteriaceae bacterium]